MIIVGDVNALLLIMDRTSRKKIQDMRIDQHSKLAPVDIYRKNTPSAAHTHPYQMHLGHAPGQTSYSAKKKLSAHFWGISNFIFIGLASH